MSTSTKKRTNVRATKKYKALIAADLSDADALAFLESTGVDVSGTKPKGANPQDLLVEAGFTPEQAAKLDAVQPKKGKKKGKKAKAKAKAAAQAGDLTAKDAAEALVAQRGLAFTRGRIYSNGPIIEAQVRVLKTGRPEVVQTSGVGRIVAVLIYREDSGDVAVQNLARPV